MSFIQKCWVESRFAPGTEKTKQKQNPIETPKKKKKERRG